MLKSTTRQLIRKHIDAQARTGRASNPNYFPPVQATPELLVALANLDPLEREVWVDRHMLQRTLQDIADEFANRDPSDIPNTPDGKPRTSWPATRERIRQIESDATNSLRDALRDNPEFLNQIEDPTLRRRVENPPTESDKMEETK